jgi:hypothetical protein
MARIEVTATSVRWLDFEQPHRRDSWNYDRFQFEFDRHQYEVALIAIE